MDRVKAHTKVEGACLVFVGHRNECGYGRIRKEGRLVMVHRAVWEMAKGPIPPGFVVMHSCDNPACYSLEHLSIGTQSENISDMDRKGRRVVLIGSAQRAAKLDEAKVASIKAELSQGIKIVDLARKHKVSDAAIANIKHGRRWTHVSAGYGG